MSTDKKLQSAPAAGDPITSQAWADGYCDGLLDAAYILRQHLPLYEDSHTALVLQDMIDLLEEESSK